MKTYDPKLIYKIDSEPYYSEIMSREEAEKMVRAKAPADVNTVALEAVK